MTVLRRVLVVLALLMSVRAAFAQDYPTRPVKVIVPFAPGGVTDVMGRLLAQKLSETLGQQFYVENHGGAGGNIGTGVAAQAAPDGYTVVVTSSSFLVNPSLNAKVPYDPIKDFTAVTISGVSPNILVVNPSVPAKNVRELIELIRKTPGKNNFASAGIGTTPHLSGELFRLSLDLDMVHVPFNGAGPALQSTIAGHTPVAFTGLPSAVPHVQQGTLRGLAVTSASRSSALPEIPTMAEAGVPGQEAETLLLVLVPAGTSSAIVALLNREIGKVLNLPDTRQKLAGFGFEPVGTSPEQSAARIKQEIPRWAKVIRDAKIEPQ